MILKASFLFGFEIYSCEDLFTFSFFITLSTMVAVLLVLTNHEDMGNTGKKTGWYLPELAHPYHVFKEAGYSMIMVSPKGGKAPLVSLIKI